ncbi:epoxide hydrolase 1-like [Hypomesus transpacificus]|uniref:epoxide hydrolase 1-like n=1 Tax=Hypomesus transpacificus TaxID=137520 RepID=UPI001F079138|nr:epoxide hydrolase 1-like [Hypomesus transpacificus]
MHAAVFSRLYNCRLNIPLAALRSRGPLLPRLVGARTVTTIPIGDGWWGSERQQRSNDTKIYKFTVETSDEEIKDLHHRLDRARYTDALVDSQFNYGFNSAYLQRIASYWRNQFDWNGQVDVLNKYPPFKTRIEGLNVHFLRMSSPHVPDRQAVQPVMLVHGWPGSFFEFYKMLPFLLQREDGLAFEVICPSIPGFGYSDAPQQQGSDTSAAARVFFKLMERLGHNQFYLQGGDWGSIIANNMAQMKPESVKGLHLNMFNVPFGGLAMFLSLLLGSYLPSLVGFSKEDVKRLYPVEKNLHALLRETGYLHIQATKPDTAGCGLNDSPVGLVAYILEKFSTWTDSENSNLEDGGLERKYQLDDLLTNVMIYWTTGSIIPSMRFYRENLKENILKRVDARTGVYVPTGLASFPGELFHCPPPWARRKYQNILSYSFMPRGGHFSAFEEPQLLADDFRKFVMAVESKAKVT